MGGGGKGGGSRAVAGGRGVATGGGQRRLPRHGMTVIQEDFIVSAHPPRYLVYDIMSVNEKAVVQEGFLQRYGRIEEEVLKPRQAEAAYIQAGGSSKFLAPPLA